MTPPHDGAPHDGATHGGASYAAAPPRVLRVREVAVAIALVAVAFAQSPGKVVADTKLDLVVAPQAFLHRALLAWDPHVGFGQLQNQAYGYLFPMGPFFLGGHLVGLPPWIVQRAWWALVLVVGFTGMLRLTAALRVGTWSTRMIAAVAFSLSPRILSTLGAMSVESWPLAVAPWVLVPLVRGRGDPRRAALASALVFACVGAVNAVATLAVLLPPALWLLTRAPGPARRRLTVWWVAGVGLASAWWFLPLLVLGRYAYPFLDYIESARITTSVTSPLNVLRGASDWVAWSPSLGQPSWPAGWWLATAAPAVLASTALAALGLVGLALRNVPERRFLVLSLLSGAFLMAVGHRGPLAPTTRELLDGPLAALRNVHKLDLLVRIPLAVGLAHVLAVAPARIHQLWPRAVGRFPASWGLPGSRAVVRAGALLAGLALVVTTGPALRGDLAPRAPFDAVPTYWRTATGWLDAHPAGRTLLAPATSFGDYRWGHTNDEPLVALTSSSVALRDAVPLGAPGGARFLDGVVDELAAGRPSAGLARALADAGIGRVLLRNDVDPRASADPVEVVRATLATSPGLRRVAAFGPRLGGTGGLLADLTVDPPARRALEVWAVGGDVTGVRATPLAQVRVLAGGPELALGASSTAFAGTATVDREDIPGAGQRPRLVTDTLRRRRLDFGAAPGADYGPTLGAADEVGRGRAAGDLEPTTADRQTVARYGDGAVVTASASASDPSLPGWRGAGTRPAAALDGDGRTAWVSADVPGPRWLEVRWPRPRDVGRLQIIATPSPGLTVPASVRVVTDTGVARASRDAGGRLVVVPRPGRTRRVRLELTGSSRSAPLTVTDVLGLTVPESLRISTDADTDAARDTWVLRRSAGRGGCLLLGDSWSCSPALPRAGEDGPTWRRTLPVSRGAQLPVQATVRPVAGPALDAVLDRTLGFVASGSSTAVDHPAARPGAAFDGDPATAWAADAQDVNPTLTLTVPRRTTLTRVSVLTDARGLRGLRSVVVTAGNEHRTLALHGRRLVTRFPALTGTTFRFSFVRTALDQAVPVRIQDLLLPDLAPRPAAAAVVTPCSVGPEVRVAGQVLAFAVRTTTKELLSGAAVPATSCRSGLDLPSGQPVVEARSSAIWSFDQLTMGRPVAGAGGVRPAHLVSDGAERRAVAVGAGPASVLTLDQGANAGWRATADGAALRPVTVDGWRQGWLLPAGGRTTVHLEFTPGRWHRRGLAVGLAALVALVALWVSAVRGGQARGHPEPPVVPARGHRSEPVAAAVLLGLALGGLVGLLAAAVALAVRSRRHVVAPLAAVSLLAAAVLAVASDSFSGGRPAWLLSLFALLLVAGLSGQRRAPARRHRAAEAVEERSLQDAPRQPAGQQAAGDR